MVYLFYCEIQYQFFNNFTQSGIFSYGLCIEHVEFYILSHEYIVYFQLFGTNKLIRLINSPGQRLEEAAENFVLCPY